MRKMIDATSLQAFHLNYKHFVLAIVLNIKTIYVSLFSN